MSKEVRRMGRLSKEMQGFVDKPPVGITCKPVVEDVYDNLVARMQGPEGSPYEKGTFTLVINVPDTYPMKPPHVKFSTPVYHPNIDKDGRICMDMLKNGWSPMFNLEAVLIVIQDLLCHPNPDDPLVKDIALEYKYDRESFELNAREHTQKHAVNTENVSSTK